MICQSCGNNIPDGAVACQTCGAPTGVAQSAPGAPQQYPPGQPMGQPPMGQPPMGQPPMGQPPMGQPGYGAPPKSRIAYILLGLFLGYLGIHNFYAGYHGKAVAQLLISLLLGWLVVPLLAVWVWVIIEIIVVTTDAQGVQMT